MASYQAVVVPGPTRAISPNIGSYALPASTHSFARNSLTVIPMARAVVSARLSLGPRSIPMAASREASKSAGDCSSTGGGSFRIAFSSIANRDLSLDCIPLSVHQNSGDGRSPTAWLFPHLIDDLKGDAADTFRRLAGDEPLDPHFPEGEPLIGAGRRPRTHRQLRFELSDSRRDVRHIHSPRGSQRNCLAASAARSSSATRASMSSISIALAAWLKIASAAHAAKAIEIEDIE